MFLGVRFPQQNPPSPFSPRSVVLAYKAYASLSRGEDIRPGSTGTQPQGH